MEAPIGLWLHGHMPRLRDEIELEIRGLLARRGPYSWWATGTALLRRDSEDALSLIATDQDSGITLGARIVLPAHRGSPEWLRIMQPARSVEEWALHGFLFRIDEEVLTGGLTRASVPDSDGVRWLAISE